MGVFRLAWRNVWRNHRRTLVTIGAMTLALIATVNYSALAHGYLHGMERNLLDSAMGDVQVFAPDYRESPSLFERIPDPAAILAKLDAAGLPACARLRGAGLGAAGETSGGVSLIGVDVARDARVSKINTQVFKGAWLDPAAPQEVVIGRRLARTLGIGPGDELVILGQAADGSVANDLYTVRGVLKGVTDVVDRTGVFLTAAAFRELLVVPTGAHQLIVRRLPDQPLATAQQLVADAAPGLDVPTWRDLMPTIATMLDSTKGVIYVMLLLVYVAIAFVVSNAMLMAVFERVREFGVLKALGVGPGGVLSLILIESAIQALLAIAAGLLLAWPLLDYLSTTGIDLGMEGGTAVAGLAWDSTLYARVTTDSLVGPVVLFVIVVALAVLYPAFKAAFIRPIRAMQHR